MPQTEAQQRASKKWAETHREENNKRIAECIKNRYQTDEEFREKKKATERERLRAKKAAKLAAEAEAAAAAAAETAPPPLDNSNDLLLIKMNRSYSGQTFCLF